MRRTTVDRCDLASWTIQYLTERNYQRHFADKSFGYLGISKGKWANLPMTVWISKINSNFQHLQTPLRRVFAELDRVRRGSRTDRRMLQKLRLERLLLRLHFLRNQSQAVRAIVQPSRNFLEGKTLEFSLDACQFKILAFTAHSTRVWRSTRHQQFPTSADSAAASLSDALERDNQRLVERFGEHEADDSGVLHCREADPATLGHFERRDEHQWHSKLLRGESYRNDKSQKLD